MKVAQKLLITYFRTKLKILSALSNRTAAASALDLFSTPLRRSRAKVPAIFSSAEPIRFSLNDYSISGHHWPAPGAKKILILHGFESSSKNFESYIVSLTARGFDVTTFDAPAHGNSSGRKIQLPSYVDAIDAIGQISGPFDGFITHSFGGLAVSHFLENVRDGAGIRLVLIAPATELTTTTGLFFSFLRLSGKVRSEFDRIILERSGHPTEYFSVRRALQHFGGQVLWLHDELDDLTPLEDALKVKELMLPNISFHITRGLGHRRIYRDPGIVLEAVNFMGSAIPALSHRDE